MKRRLAIAAVVAFTILVPAARAADEHEHDMKHRAVEQTPEWQKLTTLAGAWTGNVDMDGKKLDATVEIRMTGGGSALMHVLGKDGPYEMVTMFHPDMKRILATHYCAAHNQPRMALVPSKDPNVLSFAFVDGTNIGPGDGYMGKLVITFVDADHHDETWTYMSGGKEMAPSVFHFTRKK